MCVKNGKGTGRIIIAKRNSERIKKWFKSNPDMTIADCARALNLSWPTVKKHVKALNY